MKIGIIGAGDVGTRLARLVLNAGHEVILCNSRGPETLKETIAQLGTDASAGALQEVVAQDVVILAVWWDTIPQVMAQVQDWHNVILIDATNQLTFAGGKRGIANVEPLTGSEYVASLAPGARVVKAFNHLFGQYMDGETEEGNRVLFFAGDDLTAKGTVKPIFEGMGFYPVDLGDLATGGRLMQVGGPLNGKHFIKRKEDMCL